MTKRSSARTSRGIWPALPLAIAFGTAGCASAEPTERAQSGVFGGAPAPDDTAVVAVVNFAGGQCTGSLIAPNLVMTARHCVAKTAGEELQVVCGQTTFQPPDSPGAIFVVSLPAISNDKKDYLAVEEIRMPDGLGDDLCGTDVVLLRLKAPLSDEIVPLVPRLDPPVAPPEAYSSVGFGVDESLPDKPSSERKRLDGSKVVCVGGSCRDAQVRSNEWLGSGGPCQGDSGGPALDANGQIIGVVSRGESGCKQPVFSDVASRADWLKSEAILAANAAQQPPPSWAPCDETTPCATLKPDPNATDEGPAPTCALNHAAKTTGPSWPLLLAALALLRRRLRSSDATTEK